MSASLSLRWSERSWLELTVLVRSRYTTLQ